MMNKILTLLQIVTLCGTLMSWIVAGTGIHVKLTDQAYRRRKLKQSYLIGSVVWPALFWVLW